MHLHGLLFLDPGSYLSSRAAQFVIVALRHCRLHRSFLTGLPPRFFCHRQRSAPPSQPSRCAHSSVRARKDREHFRHGKEKEPYIVRFFSFGSRQLPIFPGSAVRNRRAAALPFASLVTHWASASLDLPPAALGSALSAKCAARCWQSDTMGFVPAV